MEGDGGGNTAPIAAQHVPGAWPGTAVAAQRKCGGYNLISRWRTKESKEAVLSFAVVTLRREGKERY